MRIMQMDCPTEEALIRKKLGSMATVKSLEFNLMQRVLTVVNAPMLWGRYWTRYAHWASTPSGRMPVVS